MKFGFVFVLFNTPEIEKIRLSHELNSLGIDSTDVIYVDNTITKKGYAYGLNKGIKILLKKKVDIIVVANPDISFRDLSRNDFEELVKKYDVASFTMIQDDRKYFCGMLDKRRMSSYFIVSTPTTRFIQCDYVTGSLMFIKSEVFKKIGLFDEKYFMYYEEVDFCLRARNAHFTVGIDSSKSYEHFEVSKYNKEKDKLIFKSWFRFFLKYSSRNQQLIELIRIPKTVYQNRVTIKSIISELIFKI